VSERVERQADGDDPLVSAVLETVDEPAAVCDPGGRLRGWNGAFADRLGAVGDLGEASFGDLIDCPSEPLAPRRRTDPSAPPPDPVPNRPAPPERAPLPRPNWCRVIFKFSGCHDRLKGGHGPQKMETDVALAPLANSQ
jgi:PAS domain-containing protein